MRTDILRISKLMRANQDSAPISNTSRKLSRKSLLIGIGVPLLVLALYFYVIGRNRYLAQSEVVVRKASPSSSTALTLGSILSNGNQESIEDARFLKTYLQSPQVLEDLNKVFDFRAAYAKRLPDLYPGTTSNMTREDVYRIFRKQIQIQLDESTGQLSIHTYAFEPDTALRLNSFLIEQAEDFVNEINQNVFKKQIGFSNEQVDLNLKRVKQASDRLKEFQVTNRLLSAETDSTGSMSYINALESRLASQRVELATLRRQFRDPRAPEIESAEVQVEELTNQIKEERKELVSPDSKNLTEKLARQAELEADLDFAKDLYKTSIASAEKTRIDSVQQQRFMAVLSKALKPEEPWQYWRHKGFLTAVVAVGVCFGLTKFLVGIADNHRN